MYEFTSHFKAPKHPNFKPKAMIASNLKLKFYDTPKYNIHYTYTACKQVFFLNIFSTNFMFDVLMIKVDIILYNFPQVQTH